MSKLRRWFEWTRMHVRDFFADGDLIRQMQRQITDLHHTNTDLATDNETQRLVITQQAQKIDELRHALEMARSQGEALVTVKKVWDALSRLEHDLGAARGAIAESKRSIGQAFEKAELLRN